MKNTSKQYSVKCPITGVDHLIIHKNDDTNMEDFKFWATKLFIRMHYGEKVLLSIDCEGWKLGILKNSLGMLQVCEILDQRYIIGRDFEKNERVSINLKSGFLVHFPADPCVIDLLSGILSHSNSYLFTYDCTSDIACLQEAGIAIRTQNIFDAQLTSMDMYMLTCTTCESILNASRMMKDRIIEASPALIMEGRKGQNRSDYYNALCFLYRRDPDPFSKTVNAEFYQYAASDLALTGIAALSIFLRKIVSTTWSQSLKKLDLIEKAQRNGNYLSPSHIRQYEFLKMSLKSINFKVSPKDDLKTHLKQYSIFDKLNDLQSILSSDLTKEFDSIKPKDLMFQLESQLIPSTSLIENIALKASEM